MFRKQCVDCNKEQYKDCQHEYKKSTAVSGFCRKCNIPMTPPENNQTIINQRTGTIAHIPQVIEVVDFVNNYTAKVNSVKVKFSDTIFDLSKGDQLILTIPYVTKIEEIQYPKKEHQHVTGQMNSRNELIKHKYCPECGELNNTI